MRGSEKGVGWGERPASPSPLSILGNYISWSSPQQSLRGRAKSPINLVRHALFCTVMMQRARGVWVNHSVSLTFISQSCRAVGFQTKPDAAGVSLHQSEVSVQKCTNWTREITGG